MYLLARFRIHDYATWKSAFDGNVDARIRHGGQGHLILHAEDDPKALTVLLEFASLGGAKVFSEDDISTLCAMREAGIVGGPHGGLFEVEYLERLESAEYDE